MVFFNLGFEEMRILQNKMNRLMRGMSNRPLLEGRGANSREIAPWEEESRVHVADMYETKNSVIAKFELPGVDKRNIELNITEDTVEVKVQKKTEVEEKRKGVHRYESRRSHFYRRLPLPGGVDSSKAEASYKEGVLKVEIPKTAKAAQKSRKIEII